MRLKISILLFLLITLFSCSVNTTKELVKKLPKERNQPTNYEDIETTTLDTPILEKPITEEPVKIFNIYFGQMPHKNDKC